MTGLATTDVVVALRLMAAAVCEAELRRLAARVPELDTHARAEITGALQRVVDTFFRDIADRVAGDARHAEALGVLFALEPSGGRT